MILNDEMFKVNGKTHTYTLCLSLLRNIRAVIALFFLYYHVSSVPGQLLR